jgi:pilus assembly protein Flp/PilA
MQLLRRFFSDDLAATAVEYAVMLALVIMVIIGAIAVVGTQTASLFSTASSQMTAKGVGT